MPSYRINNRDLVLDNEDKSYLLRVRDLPAEEKPREKIIALGPATLSVAELLAVILITGTTKEEVLNMSSRILKDYGEKSILSRTDVQRLADDLAIPISKAAQIVAAGELGRRFYHRNDTGPTVIRTSQNVYEYTAEMRNLSKEHVRGIYLNAHYQVAHDEVLSIGTLDANLIHPREVFRPALEYAAAGVILVHNHPSGVATPSETDRAVTKQIAEAGRILGIDLIDHVIVTKNGFASIAID